MAASIKQLTANRGNALKSTGPLSLEGKTRSSRNSSRHGLLSAGLLLDDEEPDAFVGLQQELQATLAPVGVLELALVEKIAIAFWRQRRMIRAETAGITLQRFASPLAKAIRQEGFGKTSEDVGEDDLGPFDEVQAEWCRAVADEIEALGEISLDTLPKSAPLVWEQLESDAEDSNPADHVRGFQDGLTGYIGELLDWCRTELTKAERRPQLLALADQVRAKRLVLAADDLELFARYQTTLDNQLYKTLRALREAQDWRSKTLEATASSTDIASDESAAA